MVYHNTVSNITNCLEEIEIEARCLTPFVSPPRSPLPYDPFAKPSVTKLAGPPNIQHSFQFMTDRIDSLEHTVRIIKDGYDGSDKSVRFGSLGFCTVQDSSAWVETNLEALKFRYFKDIYALCILVAREVNGKKDCFKKMQAVQKLDLVNPWEGAALAAFESAIPGLFTESGKGVYVKNESAFSHFPKAETWKNNYHRISHTVTTVGAGLNLQINMHVPGSSTGNRLLKFAVSLSCAFFTSSSLGSLNCSAILLRQVCQ